MYICTNFEGIALFFQKLLGRSHYFEIGSRGPAHAHLGSFMVHKQEGSVVYVPPKF